MSVSSKNCRLGKAFPKSQSRHQHLPQETDKIPRCFWMGVCLAITQDTNQEEKRNFLMLIVLPIDLKIPLQNYIFEGSFRQISISKMA